MGPALIVLAAALGLTALTWWLARAGSRSRPGVLSSGEPEGPADPVRDRPAGPAAERHDPDDGGDHAAAR